MKNIYRSIILSLVLTNISAYQQEWDKPYKATTYSTISLTTKQNIISSSIFVLGSWLHQLLFSNSSNNKPSHSWNSAQWDAYLHKKFPHLNKNTYARSVIHYYEGYQYEGFCSLVSQLSCPDYFFDELRLLSQSLISENFGLDHPLQDLSPAQRDIVHARIAQVLTQRITHSIQFVDHVSKSQLEKESSALHEEWHDSVPDCIMHAREDVWSSINNHELPYLQHYHLSIAIENVLDRYDIEPESYRSLTGIKLQQVLHTEAITLLDQFTYHQGKDITEIAVRFIDVSHAANKMQSFDQAISALNIAWILLKSVLSIGHGAAQGVYRIADHSIHLVLGTVYVVLHPIMTAQEIGKAAYYVGKFLKRYIHLIPIERLDGDFDIHIKFDERCAEILIILSALSEQAGHYIYDHPYDTLREGTAFVTEWMLFPKVCTALATLFSKAKGSLSKYIHKIKQGIQAFQEEDIPAAITSEALGQTRSTNLPSQISTPKTIKENFNLFGFRKQSEIIHPVVQSPRISSALRKKDLYHTFEDIIDNFSRYAKEFPLFDKDTKNIAGLTKKLYQIEGSLDKTNGVFEWIVEFMPNKKTFVSHRRFIKNGKITGYPNQIIKKI